MKLLQTIGKVCKPGKYTHVCWIVCVKVAGCSCGFLAVIQELLGWAQIPIIDPNQE